MRITRIKSGGGFFLFNQRGLALLGLVILLAILAPLFKNLNQKRKINQEINEMEKEIARVENKNNDLRKMINYFESDQFLEEQARLNFGLKKNGEQVAVIKENFASSTSDAQVFDIKGRNKEATLIDNNILRWRQYFFKNNK